MSETHLEAAEVSCRSNIHRGTTVVSWHLVVERGHEAHYCVGGIPNLHLQQHAANCPGSWSEAW